METTHIVKRDVLHDVMQGGDERDDLIVLAHRMVLRLTQQAQAGHQQKQQHQPQRQRVGDGGGMEPVQGKVEAEQAHDGGQQGEAPGQHAQSRQAEADPFTDHGTPPPFSADCADRD